MQPRKMEADAACPQFKSTLKVSLFSLLLYEYLSGCFVGGDHPVLHVGLSHLLE
jgi:hypothetical protein